MRANREWARSFSGTVNEFVTQAKARGMTSRSIKYWVKFNWNIEASH